MGWQDAGIEAVTGKFGGGKSYWTTLQFRNHFIRGGFCGGNLAIKWDEMKKHCRDKFHVKLQDRQWIPMTDEQIAVFPELIPASRDKTFPVHLCLEECGLFFNADSWKNADKRIKAFLPQPRKYGIRIIAIVQELNRMLVNIREQAAVVHRFRDLNKLPWGDARLGYTIGGKFHELLPYFVHSAFDYKDMPESGKAGKSVKPMKNERIRKDPAIFALYDSFNYHGGNALSTECEGRIKLERVTLTERVLERLKTI